ncbi:hypothetical protein BDV18DRAFT_129914 [Aspergillus unguis]
MELSLCLKLVIELILVPVDLVSRYSSIQSLYRSLRASTLGMQTWHIDAELLALPVYLTAKCLAM